VYGSVTTYPYVSFSVLFATSTGNGEPLAMNVTYYSSSPLAVWTFSNFSPDPLNTLADSTFAPPPTACIDKRWACTNSTSYPAVVMDFYRSHDNSSFAHVLADANVADASGEAFFACINGGNPLAGPYVTHFRVRVSTQWNLYSRCNQGQCIFYEYYASSSYGDKLGVGREVSSGGSAFNPIDSTGQCWSQSQNSPYLGWWYSLPSAGRCPRGRSIGWRNCTWEGDYEVVKTITMPCSGMQSMCGVTDWTQNGASLVSAFKTCPSVNALELRSVHRGHKQWFARTLGDVNALPDGY